MAAAMTSIVVAADVWTPVYSASSGVTIGLFNRSGDNMLVRIDASANKDTDAATAAADVLHAYETRTYPLVSGDVVIARPDLCPVSPAGVPIFALNSRSSASRSRRQTSRPMFICISANCFRSCAYSR